MTVFATDPTASELRSPFAGFAGLTGPPEITEGEAAPRTGVVLDSPFGAGLRAEAGEAGEDVLTELLDELADDEFEDAVAQLVDDAAAAHLASETAWSAGDTSRGSLQSWAESLAEQSDRLLDGVAVRLEHEDLAGMPARDLDTLLETLQPIETEDPVFEQFLGGLLKKAKSVVKGAVSVAKKAIGKVLPIGALLKKLGGLVRPLLARVLKSAMNRPPASVRPIAEKIAQKMGVSKGETLAEEFDRNVAGLLLAGDEATADQLVEEAGSDPEAPDPIGELDVARRDLGRRLTEMPAGSYPKPEIQQFLPAVMAALPLVKLGISIIGRQRVVDFIAERIADLLRSMVGPGPAKQIARPIVDAGMKLIGLEVPVEGESDVAGEALAATVETTARRALALPAAVQDDRLLLDAAVQQFFAEAAAAHLPGRLLRADLPERESRYDGGVWVHMPRKAAPHYRYLTFTQPLTLRISRPVARAVPWSDGGTLESYLLDRGAQNWPVDAEAYLYEMLPGGHLGHLRHDDARRFAGTATDGEVAPLSPETAGLLLGEPGLGKKRRLIRVRPKGRTPGKVAGPRRRVTVRIDTASTPPKLTVALRLSERQGQELIDLLTRAEGPDLPGALRKLQQIHRRSLPTLLGEKLTKHKLPPDAATALVTAVDAGLSTLLQAQAAQLTAAVRDPAQGLTVRLTVEGITAESLRSAPPVPAVTVTAGWRTGV